MTSYALLADIGGTNARFALGDGTRLHAIDTLPTADYPRLEDAIAAYLRAQNASVKRASIAIANPVTGDRVQMTNHHWNFSISALQAELGFDELHVINDFTAQALAVPHLGAEEKRLVSVGEAAADAPLAVIGPGTGLGVSALIPDGRSGWVALAGEGGHVSFAPRNDTEVAIWKYAHARRSHVSAERITNGAGLTLIDNALATLRGEASPERTPATITTAALTGEATARQTLDTYCAALATVTADLVLTLGARGGVYLCGGILPRIADYFIDESPFKARFIDKGRFEGYLAAVPIWLVTAKNPGLTGAAATLQQR